MPYELQRYQHLLAESDTLVVFHEWEAAFILFKRTVEEIKIGEFYGDPCCAAIGPDEDWVLIGGDYLMLWKTGNIAEVEGIRWAHDIRVTGRTTAEILTDPWSEESAVWKIDVAGERAEKLRDFKKYQEEPYTDDVEW
jgi:hypothetical protein